MNGNGWKSWVIGALLALVLAGTGSTLYSNALASEVEARLKEQIAELKANEEKTFEIVLEMATRLATMEAHLENIKERLDEDR